MTSRRSVNRLKDRLDVYIIIYSLICVPLGRNRINFIQSMPCMWFYNICVYACRRYILMSTTFTWFFLKMSVRLRTCDDFNVHVFYFAFRFTQLRSKPLEAVRLVTSVPVRPMLSAWGMNASVKKDSISTKTTGLEKPVCYSM